MLYPQHGPGRFLLAAVSCHPCGSIFRKSRKLQLTVSVLDKGYKVQVLLKSRRKAETGWFFTLTLVGRCFRREADRSFEELVGAGEATDQ